MLIFSFFLHRIMEQNQLLNFIIIDQYYFIEFENEIKKHLKLLYDHVH